MVQLKSSISRINRIGIVGTGFISCGLVRALNRSSAFSISRVLTRRSLDDCRDFTSPDLLTRSLSQVIDQSDLIIECTGDPIHATVVIDAAIKKELPVITMNAEFQVTSGSWFVDKGFLTEAHGDQPGCLAALNEEVRLMGFDPHD